MLKTLIATSLLSLFSLSYADYIVQLPLEQSNGGSLPSGTIIFNTSIAEVWASTTPFYTDWINSGENSDCSNWSPLANTVTINTNFTQTATDCKQKQIRTKQNREQNSNTLAYRNLGSEVTETQTITVSSTQSALGTKETWITTTPAYTAWTNSGSVNSCTDWSPSTNSVDFGVTYTQTASNCLQPQTRSKQEQEQETTTMAVRNVGSATTESKNTTVSSSRSATGTYAAIRNNPLSRFTSGTGVRNGSSLSTNGVAGAILYGPYVKNFPAGNYRLVMYGNVVETGNASFDVVSNGGNQKLITGNFTANTSGTIINTTVSIPTLTDQFGVEIRVMVSASTNLTITGYTLTPL